MKESGEKRTEGLLGESDYLWILDVLKELVTSNSMIDVNRIISRRVLPVFRSKSMIYGWTDREITRVTLVDGVGIPSETLPILEKFIPYDPVAPAIVKSLRPVMAYDVDFSRDEVPFYLEKFLKDNSNVNKSNHPYLFDLWGGITTINLPEANLGLSIHRLGFDRTPITLKDIQLLSLLGPHLLKSISEQLVREELGMYKAISRKLLDSTNPIAIFNGDYRLIFQNNQFEQLFGLPNGHFLPNNFHGLVNCDIEAGEISSIDDLDIQPVYIKHKDIEYNLRSYFLKRDSVLRDQRILVRLRPANDPANRLSLLFARNGLTHREREICLLLRNQKDNLSICERLGIRPSTLETHFKNIYKKFEVRSRAKLISTLFF